MKKYLLAIAAVAVGMTATANSPFSVSSKTKLRPELNTKFTAAQVEAPMVEVAPSRAGENEMYYQPSGEPAQALSYNNQSKGLQVGMAIQLDPDFVNALTDGKITEISFYTGSQANEKVNKINTGYVFITDDLTLRKFPFTQKVTDITSEVFTKVTVPLDSAIAIDPKKEVYVGAYFTLPDAQSCALDVDMLGHMDEYGGWAGVRSSSLTKFTWDNVTSYCGFVTVGATIQSSTFPKNSVSMDMLGGQPVAKVGEPFEITFAVTNKGANNVSKITLEYGIDVESTLTDQIEIDGTWGFGQTLMAALPDFVATKASKGSDVRVKVTEVDGTANTNPNTSLGYNVVVVPANSDLPRNVLIEEFTSTSCVYCPVGYTAMERLREDFPDGNVIPVCVHVNTPSSDPMTSTTYSAVYTRFGGSEGVPSSTIDRTYTVYPQYASLIEYAQNILALPAVASVDGEATLNPETRELTINTKTSFAFDYSDGNEFFALAYGITEDNVGPYNQSNGYSQSGYVVDGDWQLKPTTVSLVYNDVARQLDNISGVKGTIPSEIKAGEVYDYTHNIKLIQAIKDLEKINVVVYLLNLKTKAVENSCILKSKGNGSFSSGIENIAVDNNNAPVEYYNMQGVRVENPSAGLYIRRQGTAVTKTIIR